MQVLKKLDNLDKEAKSVIEEWESNLTTFAVTQCMSDLKIKYKNNLKIQNFLYSIQSDVIKNIDYIKQYEESQSKNNQQVPQQMMMQMSRMAINKPWDNYRVNLLVDNFRCVSKQAKQLFWHHCTKHHNHNSAE